MIDLYTASTPNGWKASVTLEELKMPYGVHEIKLSKGGQKSESFFDHESERPHPRHC